MAILKAYAINFYNVADGTSTSYSFDLESDPYYIPAQTINWFTEAKKLPNPVGVISTSPSVFGASLSGTVVTLTFAQPPAAGPGSYAVYLTFA